MKKPQGRHWPVGKGWYPLLERLEKDLYALGWNGTILQVKEKWGTLRFYIGQGSDAIFDRIWEAEKESASVCEECGQKGRLRTTGWYQTLCDEHHKEINGNHPNFGL